MILTLSDQIRIARQKAGLTQQQLGDRVGMQRILIGKLESPITCNPTLRTTQKIATALNAQFVINPEEQLVELLG